jgi:GDP-4-dehydro-6-deoxy-D-mannose reductase
VSIRTIVDLLSEISGIHPEVLLDPARTRTDDAPKIVGSSARLRSATGWKPEVPLRTTLGDLLAYWEDRLRLSA